MQGRGVEEVALERILRAVPLTWNCGDPTNHTHDQPARDPDYPAMARAIAAALAARSAPAATPPRKTTAAEAKRFVKRWCGGAITEPTDGTAPHGTLGDLVARLTGWNLPEGATGALAGRLAEALREIEHETDDPDVGADSFTKAWGIITRVHSLADAALSPETRESVEAFLLRLLDSDEARAAWLGQSECAWFRASVDQLRAFVRDGGDPFTGLGLILAAINAEKARVIRDEIHRRALDSSQPIIVPWRTPPT